MSRYRVISVQWVDVVASSQDDATRIAADFYYNLQGDEYQFVPTILETVDCDDDPIVGFTDVILDYKSFSPVNELSTVEPF